MKLAELFQASRGGPIEWDGREVHMVYDLEDLESGSVLQIEFEHRTAARPQALRLKAKGGSFEVNEQLLDDVVLWAETAPPVVPASLRPSAGSSSMSVRMWNAWRDPAGTMQAWIGNAGMVVTRDSGGTVRLHASDGYDEPTFDDLVVTVRVLGLE